MPVPIPIPVRFILPSPPFRHPYAQVLGCHECTSGAKCSKNKCAFAQSYTEGSSWNAYQMQVGEFERQED
jgi:hypothetical protein